MSKDNVRAYCVAKAAFVFVILQILFPSGAVLKIGEYHSPVHAEAHSNHVMGLGQSRASKNIRNIILSNNVFYSSVLGDQVTVELRG